MPPPPRKHADDLRGATRLAVDATRAVSEVVEELHRTIGAGPAVLGKPLDLPMRVVTGLMYGSLRGVTGAVGVGLDRALVRLGERLGESAPGPERDALLAVLNGVIGDYLEATGNPLATPMSLRSADEDAGPPPAPEAAAAALDVPGAAAGPAAPATSSRPTPRRQPSRRMVVLVHGSCMHDRQWQRGGHDHGRALERDLGWSAVYARYNTGRHVSRNGHELAEQLDALVREWPTALDELAIVAHSMGGLVARSAIHSAQARGLGWRERLGALVCLGTPHHGAKLEQGGNLVPVLLGMSRFSAPLAKLARVRSEGVTDLRYGNVLDEHWQGRDRFAVGGDHRTPLPLPTGVRCHAVAGRLASGTFGAIAGDGLVQVDSALGQHADPARRLEFSPDATLVVDRVGHLDLLSDAQVYEALRRWLA